MKRERQRALGYIARFGSLLAWAAMAGGGVRQRCPQYGSDWLWRSGFAGYSEDEGPRIAWKGRWKKKRSGVEERLESSRVGRATNLDERYLITR